MRVLRTPDECFPIAPERECGGELARRIVAFIADTPAP
jgi:hypothetical protein